MPRSTLASTRRAAAAALIASLLGCAQAAVEWSEPAPLDGSGASVSLASADTGAPVESIRPRTLPPGAERCSTSVRTAAASPGLHAVWWDVRPDSSANLVASTSPDRGRSWGPVVTVDSTDRSLRGCSRPAPAIAAQGNWVYVAYAMDAREGTGVFFSHSMERGTLYHWPIVITYGEKLVETAIAAEGRTVVVAYEEPNSNTPRVYLAVSKTDGHSFDARLRASTGSAARIPWVFLDSATVTVSYLTGDASRRGTRVVRTGRLR